MTDWLRPAKRSASVTLPPGCVENVILLDLDPRQFAPFGAQLVAQWGGFFSFFSSSLRAAIHSSCDTTLCSRLRLFRSDGIVFVLIFAFRHVRSRACGTSRYLASMIRRTSWRVQDSNFDLARLLRRKSPSLLFLVKVAEADVFHNFLRCIVAVLIL